MISRKEYDGTLTDVWSIGVLLYHLFHGCLPFNDTAHIRAADYQVSLSPPHSPPPSPSPPPFTPPYRRPQPRHQVSQQHMPASAHDLLRTILVVRADARATLTEVIAHPWTAQWWHQSLREPRRRFGLTYDEPDAQLAQHIEDKFGLRADFVVASLRSGEYNHATATYSLLEEGERRDSRS